jgi:hypothetical protein
VSPGGHARQSGHGFTLAAGGQYQDFIRIEMIDFFHINANAMGELKHIQFAGYGNAEFDASAVKYHFPAPGRGDIHHLLDSVYI